MPSPLFASRALAASLSCFAWLQPAAAEDDRVDFSADYERIYQIRVVSEDAGGKAAIGSGFQVSADGLIVTNYHVVSEHVISPERYAIRYATHDGRVGELELLDFDVIGDLAVLRHPDPSDEHFTLAADTPARGERAWALGNPGDWGIVMVPGPTNGLVEHSYEDRVLFSGSLNSGMSGGPSLNREGEVIGVNVATAGSQLSFLVPAAKVDRLVSRERHLRPEAYEAELASQLAAWQRPRIGELLDATWDAEPFDGRDLFGEIRRDFQCWGDTNESNEERAVATIDKWCRTGDDVYLGDGLNAGQIRFSFETLTPVRLNAMQFARAQSLWMSADNRSDHEHSTSYACETDFVDTREASGGYHRLVTCLRAHRKMPGLYDSLLMSLRHDGSSVFKAHLSMSAVERDQIGAMNRRFVERVL